MELLAVPSEAPIPGPIRLMLLSTEDIAKTKLFTRYSMIAGSFSILGAYRMSYGIGTSINPSKIIIAPSHVKVRSPSGFTIASCETDSALRSLHPQNRETNRAT
jgi:hypothetical protein